MLTTKEGEAVLDDRKLNILYAIIKNYISNAEPVGSRTISKSYDLGISSATIRNEMSDLESLGYLNKAHSSSGRIPSDKAYRHYVNHLISQYMEGIDSIPTDSNLPLKKKDEIEELIASSAKLLSDKTQYTSVAIFTTRKDAFLKKIKLVNFDEYDYVLVVSYDDGKVKSYSLRLRQILDEDTLLSINIYLNKELVGINLRDLPYKLDYMALKSQLVLKTIFIRIKEIIGLELKEMKETHIIYDGLSNIFNYPEYKDVDKAKEFVDFLEDKAGLIDLLDREEDISISIGEENKEEKLYELAIISQNYDLEGDYYGRIGIIGPKRMNYRSVIESIRSLANALEAIYNNHEVEGS